MTDEQYNKEILKRFEAMSEDEKAYVQTVEDASKVYGWVLSQLNVEPTDVLHRNLVLGILKRQTKDHMVVTTWGAMKDRHLKPFRDYVNRAAVIAPNVDIDDLLISFAMDYPDLAEILNESLGEFFKQFIVSFNKINKL